MLQTKRKNLYLNFLLAKTRKRLKDEYIGYRLQKSEQIMHVLNSNLQIAAYNLVKVEKPIIKKSKFKKHQFYWTSRDHDYIFGGRRASRILKDGFVQLSFNQNQLRLKRLSIYAKARYRFQLSLTIKNASVTTKFFKIYQPKLQTNLTMTYSRRYFWTAKEYLKKAYFISNVVDDFLPRIKQARWNLVWAPATHSTNIVLSGKSHYRFQKTTSIFFSLRVNYASTALNINSFLHHFVEMVRLRPRKHYSEIDFTWLNYTPKFVLLEDRERMKRESSLKLFFYSFQNFSELYTIFYKFRIFSSKQIIVQRTHAPIEYEVKIAFVRKSVVLLFTNTQKHVFLTYSAGNLTVAGLPKKKSRKLLTTKIRMFRVLQAFLLRAQVLVFNLQIYGFSADFKKYFATLMQISAKRIHVFASRHPRAPLLKPYPFHVPFVVYNRPEIHHAFRAKRRRRIKRKIVKRLLRKNGIAL